MHACGFWEFLGSFACAPLTSATFSATLEIIELEKIAGMLLGFNRLEAKSSKTMTYLSSAIRCLEMILQSVGCVRQGPQSPNALWDGLNNFFRPFRACAPRSGLPTTGVVVCVLSSECAGK